jgi:hypothetical protein
MVVCAVCADTEGMDLFDHFPLMTYDVLVNDVVEASYPYRPQFRGEYGNPALRSAEAHAAFLNGVVRIGWDTSDRVA